MDIDPSPGHTFDRDAVVWPLDDERSVAEAAKWQEDVFSFLSGSRSYFDLRGFEPQDVATVLEIEDRVFSAHRVDREALAEELADDLEREYGFPVAQLDAGTASAVIALSALGCASAVSCNALEGHQYRRPMVAFWARQEVIDAVVTAAAATQCGLENGANGTIVVHAKDIRGLRDFARAIAQSL